MNKRALVYARVSGDDRANDNRNLESQIEMGREYCENNGYSIIAELAEDDKGASGASYELEQLNRLLEMARKGEFDVLVVREIDRLSRRLAKQLIIEEELKRSGVEINYVLGEYPDTPEGNLQKNIKATIAEYEREKIRERTMRGRKKKARSGKVIGNCLPYGYKNIGEKNESNVIVEETEAEIVRKIFRWFLTKKTSLRQIASWLTDENIPLPGLAYNKPGVGVWMSSTVRRMLSNPSYIGKFSHSGIEINVPELSIVDEEDFNLVQEILNKNKKWQRKKGRDATSGRYLLLDHIYCSCGYRMTGKIMTYRKGKTVYYYGCVTKCYPKQKNPCKEIYVRVSKADDIIWEWLKRLLSMDEDRLRKGLNGLANSRENDVESKRKRIEAIESQIDNISDRIGGLMRAFSGDDDEDVIAQLRIQVNSLKKTRSDLIAQRERFMGELSKKVITQKQIDGIVSFANQIRRKMINANINRKMELIKFLNVRVGLVSDEDCYRLAMSCDLPGSEHAEVYRLCKSHSSNKKVASA